MSNRRNGSVLIFALVAVTVLSLLTIGLAIWLRPKLALADRFNTVRAESEQCFAAINAFANEILLVDTNGYDSVNESWRNPYSGETVSGVTILSDRPQQNSDDLQGAIDEESKLPLNLDTTGPLEELIKLTLNCTHNNAAAIANEIKSLGPLVCIEQLKMTSCLDEEKYQKIAPYITTAPIRGININTAPELVLKALFSEAKRFDAKAAETLSSKILAYRQSGRAFTSADQSHLNSELNGLSQAELLLVGAAKDKIVVESRCISGKATAKSTAIYFTYDRVDEKLIRTVLARE